MNQATLPRVCCLMGPTGVGKSQTALDLLVHGPFEIISVDSAMVYRGLNIGSAKPEESILKTTPHHLINIRDPEEAYSAADFVRDATEAIEEILARQKIPLLVGGTMLYYKALQQGLSLLPSADVAVRLQIEVEAKHHGWEFLHQALQQVDPESARRIHPNDPQRISRALEVYRLTGKTLTEHWQDSLKKSHYDFCSVAILPTDRAVLHERLAARFLTMLKAGLIEEVIELKKRPGLTADKPSMRSVGYRQVWEYLEAHHDQEWLIAKATAATRQLAKRQFTWLRSWPLLQTVPEGEVDKVAVMFLEKAV